MNKKQLSEAIALETGLSKIEARKSLDAFIGIVSKTLSEGDRIAISGFGTFSVEKKSARMGRDPRNGSPIKIAARNVVKFRPGVELSERIK